MKFKLRNVLAFFVFVSLVLIIYLYSSSYQLSALLSCGLLLVLLILYFVGCRPYIKRKHSIIGLILITYYAICLASLFCGLFFEYDVSYVKRGILAIIIITASLLGFICATNFSMYYKRNIRAGVGWIVVVLTLLMLLFVSSGFSFDFYNNMGLFHNPNWYGCLLFFLMIAILLNTRKGQPCGSVLYSFACFLMLLIFVFLLFFVQTRGASLAFFAMIAFFYCFPVVSRYKTLYVLSFVSVVLFFASFSYFYAYSVSSDIQVFIALEEFSQEYFGRSLTSSRVVAWVGALDDIYNYPLLGKGLGASHTPTGGVEMIHNIWLSIAYRTGFLGLGTFVAFLIRLWVVLWEIKDKYVFRVLSSSIFGLMVLSSTYNVLGFTHFGLSMCGYILLGFSYGQCFRR